MLPSRLFILSSHTFLLPHVFNIYKLYNQREVLAQNLESLVGGLSLHIVVAVVGLDVICVIGIVATVIIMDHCDVAPWQLLVDVKVDPKRLKVTISQVQMLAWMLVCLIVRAGTSRG